MIIQTQIIIIHTIILLILQLIRITHTNMIHTTNVTSNHIYNNTTHTRHHTNISIIIIYI